MAKKTSNRIKTWTRMWKKEAFDRGPLLCLFDWATKAWGEWCSLLACSFVQAPTEGKEPAYLCLRDMICIALFCLSIFLFRIFPNERERTLGARVILAFAAYQVFALTITLFRLGILGHTRGQRGVWALSENRVRRLLLLSIGNYVELIFWFAIIYLDMGLRHPEWFPTSERVDTQQAALFLSMSTMLTIGYGKYAPVATQPILLAILQGVLALVITVIAVASLVSLATGRDRQAYWGPAAKHRGWKYITPLVPEQA